MTATIAIALVLRVTAGGVAIGPYRVFTQPTYAGAIAALGLPSSCTLRYRGGSDAVVVWRELDVSMNLVTYGGIPPSRNACTAPASMPVSTVRVRGRWRTAVGLRVGDTVSTLRRRYPNAVRSYGWRDWFDSGWWIAWRWTPCVIGVCSPGLHRAPILVAETRGGRVTSFVVVVGAQGE